MYVCANGDANKPHDDMKTKCISHRICDFSDKKEERRVGGDAPI